MDLTRRQLLWLGSFETAIVVGMSTGCRGAQSARTSAYQEIGGSDLPEQLDALIVGGGPAGMTAALYLGRARKTVLVVDEGTPRHAVADRVHNFLSREGVPPAELRRLAWEQMRAYPSVARTEGRVATLRREEAGWRVESARGQRWAARAVLLAVGVIDQHPTIPGYREKWGSSIHHCPYCHGWEMREQPLAVLGHDEGLAHLAPLLRGWSRDIAVVTNGHPLPDDVREELTRREIPVRTERIQELAGPGSDLEAIVFEDGTRLPRSGLFVVAEQRPVDLIRDLGVALDGPFVRVDEAQQTSLPRLWAAGDCTTRMQQVVEAAAQGAQAAARINAELTLGH